MTRLLLLLIWLAGPVSAQAVMVKTGDHEGFTRVVMTFPATSTWDLGRTAEGYEFVHSPTPASYDFSDAFRVISRARLTSIGVHPSTGNLMLNVACACYAIPFEFSENTLVIDIRDGVAPVGSVFERALGTQTTLSPLGSAPAPRPQAARRQGPSYDWLAAESPAPQPIVVMPRETERHVQSALKASADLQNFRDTLISQVARGASVGVVGMMPQPSGLQPADPEIQADQPRVVLGELPNTLPGLEIVDRSIPPSVSTDGTSCPADESLSIRDWSSPEDPLLALATSNATLLTEFDQPDHAGIASAVRTQLYHGFGAEARTLMRAFAPAVPLDPQLMAISYLVDSDRSGDNPFKGMQSCESSAAFWATLAAPVQTPLIGLNGTAVSRTFLGLPKHLKLIFASPVADQLLAAGDEKNAELVRSGVERSAPDGGEVLPLLEADIALHKGDAEAADRKIDEIAKTTPNVDALLSRVKARFQKRQKLDEKDVLALEAFAFEQGNGPRQKEFQTAMVHAKALSDDFGTAFALAQDDARLITETWDILGATGSPSAVLTFAAGAAAAAESPVPAAIRELLAQRLADLGLPSAARRWLPETDSALLLRAEIELAESDGRGALQTLASMPDAAPPGLLAEAYRQIGDLSRSAQILEGAGKDADADRLRRWARLWPDTQVAAPDVWSGVVDSLPPSVEAASAPMLERSRNELENSVVTRARIAELLAAVPAVATK